MSPLRAVSGTGIGTEPNPRTHSTEENLASEPTQSITRPFKRRRPPARPEGLGLGLG